jgi:tRNA(Leu) C34 or U34 (ribose-2'-O)-methylase TrmL
VKLLKDGVSTSITKKVLPYMTLHQHETTTQCIEALRSSGHEIWATDLSPGAVKLDSPELVIPEKLAIVFGRELDGCSQEILKAADKRVFIPIFGFAESLNLSVAASLVMQTLFTKCPEARGNLTQAEKAVLREKWYMILGRNSEAQRERFRSFLTNPPEPLDDIRRMDKTTLATGAVRDKMRREAPSSPTEILEDPLMDLTGTASPSSSPPAAKKPKIEENTHL